MEKQTPSLRDWISVGRIRAVVCRVSKDGKRVEVVFNKDKPTNLYVMRVGDDWDFEPSPDYGGYADKYPRLKEFVAILKRGEHDPYAWRKR